MNEWEVGLGTATRSSKTHLRIFEHYQDCVQRKALKLADKTLCTAMEIHQISADDIFLITCGIRI